MEANIPLVMAASWGAVDLDWRIIPLLIFAMVFTSQAVGA
jgi:hypothetical protein